MARYETSTAGTPGPTAYGRPDLDASVDRDDLVLAASLRRGGPSVSQQLGVGYALTDQLSKNPDDSGCFVPEWEGTTGSYPNCDFPNPRASRTRPTGWSARTRPISRPDRVTC